LKKITPPWHTCKLAFGEIFVPRILVKNTLADRHFTDTMFH
jgi:hypothetical protein